MESICINSVGLIIDIIGVILIFLFGITPTLNLEGAVFLIAEQEDEKVKKKAKIYKGLSILGLILVFLGFVFQLIGNLIK